MELNEKLAMLRKNNGYSTRELGEKLGVSQSSVSLWEKGARRPDMGTLVKIANLYGVSTDYLLGSDSDSDKSEIIKLNEKRNILENKYSLTRKKIDLLQKKQYDYENDLKADIAYRNTLKHSENFADSKTYNNLIKIVESKIEKEQLEIKRINEEISLIRRELTMYKKEIDKSMLEIQEAQKKMLPNRLRLDRPNSRKYTGIYIRSEEELWEVMLDYLGFYKKIKKSDYPPKKAIDTIKKIIDDSITSIKKWP